MADILCAEDLKVGLQNKSAESFQKLMQLEWGVRVTSYALRQASTHKLGPSCPTTSFRRYITTLHKYLSKQEECIKSDMRNHGITDNNFAELAQCTLAEVVLYNRKVPTVTACKDAIESCQIFKKRTVVQVKSKVWTLVQKMRTDRSGE